MKRRELLIAMGLGSMLAALPVRRGLAEEATEDADDEIDLLFVQTAHGTSLAEGVMTLRGVGASTLYFSDRPERVTGHLPTDVFVERWTEGGDESFASVPPNAVLSVLGTEEALESVLVLKAPRLESGDLVYDVEVLEGSDSISAGAGSLFIDSYHGPIEPAHYRGRHRRVRRHKARRRHRRRGHNDPGPG